MNANTLITLSRRAALAAGFATLFTGCASVSTPITVADTIATTPSLSTLNGLVHSAGLSETLNGAGTFTIFAPTNDAFKVVPTKTMELLAKDPAALKYVLTFHVLPIQALAVNIRNGKVKTVNGAEVELSKAGDMVTVENAVVTQADLVASNGVVHIIDTVLIPPVKK